MARDVNRINYFYENSVQSENNRTDNQGYATIRMCQVVKYFKDAFEPLTICVTEALVYFVL